MGNIFFCFSDSIFECANSVSCTIFLPLLIQRFHNLSEANAMIQAHVVRYFIQCFRYFWRSINGNFLVSNRNYIFDIAWLAFWFLIICHFFSMR